MLVKTIQTKTCSNKDCPNPEKPATREFFYTDKSSADGFTSWCKHCQKAKYTPKTGTDEIKPDDFMADPQGRLVPLSLVKEIDKTRDSLVRSMVADAKAVRAQMQSFKQTAMDEVRAFVDLAAMEWDVALGGKKGNITLHSFDGRLKVQIQVAEHLVFDEQLQVAKKMIDQCLTEWTQGSNDKIKAIINDAFQVDKEGRINTNRILSLRRLNIKDELWIKAMDAITASLQVVGSKEYIRLYERIDTKAQWRPVTLDMAAI